MANYYDWNPPDDKKPAVDADDQPEPSPIAPPEPDTPAAPVESLAGTAEADHWSPDEFAAATPALPDDELLLAPIDDEDELHPMYRVVSALMDSETAEVVVDEQAEPPAVDAVLSEAVVADVVDSDSPTETLTDALLADADLPPLPTRIDDLTQAIERYPQSPVNYVLRGEAHWEEGHGADAVRDFLTALQLAESRDTTWEFLNRSFLDRARQGLRRCGYTNRTEY